MNDSHTPAFKELIRRKIADGMTQARAGNLVDGKEAVERLETRLRIKRKKTR